jgi:hypothetical protein
MNKRNQTWTCVCACVRSSVTLDVILYRLKRQTLASRLARLTRTDVRRTEPARQLSCRPAPVIRGSLIDSLTLQTTTGDGRGEGCRIKLTHCDREFSFPIASTVVVGLYGYRLLCLLYRGNGYRNSVAKFKYLATTPRGDGCMVEEIKNRLDSVHTCYHWVLKLLSFHCSLKD